MSLLKKIKKRLKDVHYVLERPVFPDVPGPEVRSTPILLLMVVLRYCSIRDCALELELRTPPTGGSTSRNYR